MQPKQRDFFEQPSPEFNGPCYDPALDKDRLTKQIGRVFDFMRDHEWHTLREIGNACGDPEASVSAQLRHLKKAPFGAYIIDKKRIHGGLWGYRLRKGRP